MARAPTSDESVKLRSNQKSKTFAAVLKGETVYSALVNQATFTNPMVQVTYEWVSGTLANVLEGMTVIVSTSAGVYVGQARVRKAPTSTVLYIGETSEIAWADDLCLTVVREFALWQRHIRTVGGLAYMDYDIAYSDQHADCDPIVIMGPPQVVWLVDGLATIRPSSFGSWVPGSSILSTAWTAPRSASSSDLTEIIPTIGYIAADTYYISCTKTALNGKVTTRWLPVFVFDADNPPLEVADVGSCEISKDSGGWDFSVSVYAGAEMDAIRTRAMVVLFSQDWYGDEEGSIGPLAGSENVLNWGWIGLERITRRRRAGKVDFSVWGPAHWLGQMSGYPVGIENVSGAAYAWTQFVDLTVDAGLWHLATWRSTMSLCMDVFPSGDTRLVPTLEPLVGTVWAQLQAICHDTILADPICDRYGRLFVEAPVWALPDPEETDRSSVPVVMTLTEDDWSGEMDLEVNPVGGAGMIEASGVAYDGSTSLPMFSHAPGGTLGRFGGMVSFDNLLVEDQDQLNELAGMIYAHENNPYPAIDIELAENNRMIDVAPRQRIAAPIATDDTPREIDLPDLYLLPTRISMKYNVKNGDITFSIEAEAETSGPAGITYIPPSGAISNLPANNPSYTGPGTKFPPPTIWFPPILSGPPDGPGGGPGGDPWWLDQNAVCKSANPGSINGPYGMVFSP
ncbi:MAG: hypothetical protein IMZ62_13890, partial [Chloroflexi bacterium]|nr:hypothetical protein [Chloroflexota bacterium]